MLRKLVNLACGRNRSFGWNVSYRAAVNLVKLQKEDTKFRMSVSSRKYAHSQDSFDCYSDISREDVLSVIERNFGVLSKDDVRADYKVFYGEFRKEKKNYLDLTQVANGGNYGADVRVSWFSS